MISTTVDLLRHGDVAGGCYYRGSTDDPLTKQGWHQMKSAVAERQWNRVITSPLHRCRDFAQDLNTKTGMPCTIEANWQEINFGDWEGKTAEQISSEELSLFYQDPVNNTPNNAESFLIFQSRIKQAWDKLISMHAGDHLLVITHAGVIRCLFTVLLGLPVYHMFNLQIDHASLTRFQCIHDDSGNFIKLVFSNKSGNS